MDRALRWPQGIGADGGLIALIASFSSSMHTSPVTFPLSNDRMDQAGTGGARGRAMCARICPNIRPNTATSAIRNVK